MTVTITTQGNPVNIASDHQTVTVNMTNYDTSAQTAIYAAQAAASAAQAALYDGPWLDNVAAILADTSLTYTTALPGTVVVGEYVQTRSEGFSYQVAANSAVDYDLITAGGVKLYGKGPSDLRKNSNVRGTVNFFDFLMSGYTAAEREQIAAGTYTGDLAVPWTAFRNALSAISAAGKRPHGIIPECLIRTSVALNFAMDYLHLETRGNVRVLNTSTGAGIIFDGRGIGRNGFGIREMYIGPLEASSWSGTVGYNIMWCQQSTFDRPSSRGGSFAGLQILGCVSSEFRTPMVSPQSTNWINNNAPTIPIYISSITATPSDMIPRAGYCSWSTLINPIGEYGINACIQLDNTYGMTIIGGTAEGGMNTGTGRGLVLGANTSHAKIISIDCEGNFGADILCLGSENDFIGVDTMLLMQFGSGAWGNKVLGGSGWTIQFDSGSYGNLLSGANANTITDSSTTSPRNRISNCMRRASSSGVLIGTNWHNDWQSYTPTVTSTVGTITTSSAVGEYQITADRVVNWRAVVTITTNGTGSGVLQIGLPTTAAVATAFSGVENGLTAKSIGATVSAAANVARCRFADGTYPGANGAVVTINGSYKL